jgi:hypothetical protein
MMSTGDFEPSSVQCHFWQPFFSQFRSWAKIDGSESEIPFPSRLQQQNVSVPSELNSPAYTLFTLHTTSMVLSVRACSAALLSLYLTSS